MCPRFVIARMDHHCCGCRESIGKGEICIQRGFRFGGSTFWHAKCFIERFEDPDTVVDPKMTRTVAQRAGMNVPSRLGEKEEETIREEREGYNCEVCGKWMRAEDALFCHCCEDPLCENCGPLSVCPRCTK